MMTTSTGTPRRARGHWVAIAATAALLVAATATVQAAVPWQEQAERSAKEQAEKELAGRAQAMRGAKAELARRLALRSARPRALLRGPLQMGAMRERAGAPQQGERDRLRVRLAPRGDVRLRSHGGGMADHVLAIADHLELTEAQEQQVRDTRRAHRRAGIERDAAIEVAELDLEELMQDRHTADLDAVEATMRQISELRVEDRMSGLRLDRTIYGLLTEEQREQMDERRNRFFFRRGDGPAAFFFDGDGLAFEGGEFALEGPLEWEHAFELDDGVFDADRWLQRFRELPFRTWHFEHEHDDDDEDEDDEEQKESEREGIKT